MKKYIGLDDMSSVNCSSVLDVIRSCRSISRRQISDITGLSWGGTTKIVNKLYESGYIEEEKEENAAGAGRTPGLLHITREKNVVIGLDFNREGFSACVMNLGGDILEMYEEEVSFEGKDELLQTTYRFTDGIADKYMEKNILSFGIAMQGMVDTQTGVVREFPHCADWKDVPLRALLEKRYSLPVFVEHDPNCMLYAQMFASESENMLLFRLDRSVGMAVSINGKILRGNSLLEVAHCTVVPGGKRCKCGKMGCMEAYLSPCLQRDSICLPALGEALEPLSVLICNMVKLFHSDTVILTGKLAGYRADFEEELRQMIKKCETAESFRLWFAEENELAVQGAARIAAQGAVDAVQI